MELKKYALLVLILAQTHVQSKEVEVQNLVFKYENGTIVATKVRLPATVYNILERAGKINSVLHSKNDINLRWVGEHSWIYEFNFEGFEEIKKYTYVMLTFQGIDTRAVIYLNKQVLGVTDNMFTRYTFDIKNKIKDKSNNITIKCLSPIKMASERWNEENPIPPKCPPERYNGICHINLLRKTQSSFGWDMTPAVPTMGIWKPVVFELYNTALIRDVTYYLTKSINQWIVKINIYFELGKEKNEKPVKGNLSASIIDLDYIDGAKFEKHIEIIADEHGNYKDELRIKVPANEIHLWWPNEYGTQYLYYLKVKFEDDRAENVSDTAKSDYRSEKLIKIGFRTIELVEEKAPDSGKSFYFKVNGVPIFMKGSNYIPASIHPELTYNKEKIKSLLKAAKKAHMNILRVWAGGAYENTEFYSLADEYGILIWQDMMFTGGMYSANKTFLNSVQTEVQQNVRRLQSHTSIAIWSTNNKNELALVEDWYNTSLNCEKYWEDYQKLYYDTIKKEIGHNDPTRIVLNSSPSNGNSLPSNENSSPCQSSDVIKDPQDRYNGDMHFYDYESNLWNSWIYKPGRFVSEYGVQSFPSLRSLKASIDPDEDLGELIDHRQHFPDGSEPILNLIRKNLPDFDEKDFKTLVYFSQLSQAMAMKAQTNVYRVERGKKRSMNTMGAIYAHLNDVWTAPSWSSIEFSGRHKILHNYIKDIFNREQVVGLFNENKTIDVFIVREKLDKNENYTLIIRLYRYGDLSIVKEEVEHHVVEANSVKHVKTLDIFKNLQEKKLDHRRHLVKLILREAGDGRTLARDYVLLTEPKNALDVGAPMIEHKIVNQQCLQNHSIVSTELRIHKIALFIYLEITNPNITDYKFSSNGFIQVEPIKVITVEFKNYGCEENKLDEDDIQIMTVNDYMTKI